MHPSRAFAAILDGPLTPQAQAGALRHAQPADSPGADGALLRFEGIVRRPEPDHTGKLRSLLALDYETYDPMAQRELESLALDILARHSLASIAVLHSRGRVAVGEVSFVLIIRSPHRAESLAAMGEFIDRMKQDVPIWKRPVWE